MHLALPVPAHDHRLLAHARYEVIARLFDLAFVSDEQPGPGEDLLQLPLVDLLVYKDLPADLPFRQVYVRVFVLLVWSYRHGAFPPE